MAVNRGNRTWRKLLDRLECGHLPTLPSDRFAAASLLQLVDLDPSARGNYGLLTGAEIYEMVAA